MKDSQSGERGILFFESNEHFDRFQSTFRFEWISWKADGWRSLNGWGKAKVYVEDGIDYS